MAVVGVMGAALIVGRKEGKVVENGGDVELYRARKSAITSVLGTLMPR